MNIANILLRSSEWSLNRCSSILLTTICRANSTYMKRDLKWDYDLYLDVSTNLDLPPIVICHGLFSNKKQWAKSARELNALTGRKVISYDAVNHGASSHHESMDYFNMSADLHNFLEKLEISKKVILLGHRMGGKTAMTLTLAQPERVSKLIVIDSAPLPRRESLLGDITLALKLVLSIDLSSFKTKEDIQKRIEEMDIEPLLRETVIDNIIMSPDGRFMWSCNFVGVMDSYKEVVSFPSFKEDVSCSVPALFLGDNHKYEKEVPLIMKRFSEAVMHPMDKCEFFLHKDMPDDLLNVVSEFINT